MSDASLQPVVCAVDFSDVSAAALHFASQLAGLGQSRLIAVYADWFEAPPYFTEGDVTELRRQFREATADADRRLREFVAATLGDKAAGVETKTVEGSPAPAILCAAAQAGAGMVVMGTHGRTGWNRWTMGSVAERVLRESPVPVVTVRSPSGDALHRILCPVNDTEVSRQALGRAIEMAARLGAMLTVLHVTEPQAGHPVSDVCGWVGQDARANCTIRELVRHGDPAEEIVALSRGGEFDLIVLGAPHRRFFEGMILGSTTLRVVRHAECPVLIVPGQQAV